MATKKLVGVGAGLALLLSLTACNAHDETRGIGDAPVGKHDDTAAEAVNFPDQFANVTTKCNHGNRIYSTTRTGGPIWVIPADPTCGGS
jgi:hypothetical protein